MSLTGQCLCGAVRYEATGDPLFTGVCHCRNCQRQSGSAFSVFLAVPASAVTWSGELKSYADQADDGTTIHRQFCGTCGSALLSTLTRDPDIAILKAGTLDDPSGVTPKFQIWCDSAQPWVKLEAGRHRFARGAPSA